MILVIISGPSRSQLAHPDEYLDGYSKDLYNDCGFSYDTAWKAKSKGADEDYTSWGQSWDLAKKFRAEHYKDNSESFIAFWYYNGELYQLEWIDQTWPTDNEIWVWKFDDFSDVYTDGEPPTAIVGTIPSTAEHVRKMVATWYRALR